MKPKQQFDLAPLRRALAARKALLTQQTELQETKVALEASIESDRASGAIDDPEIIARLASNRSRLEMFPALFSQLKAQIAKATKDIQDQFGSVVYHIAQVYRDTVNDYDRQVRELLKSLGVPEHHHAEFARQITALIPAVQQVEAVKNAFALPSVTRTDDLVLSMASRAEELISKWQEEQPT